jgi:hypothetical protein
MPTIQEIKLALGKMDESSENPSREVLSLNENVQPNPFSEKLFAPVEKLENEIQYRDEIIENLKKESIKLKNQVSRVEEEKSTILEELEKSRWLESKAILATKKVYEDKVKSVINENVDSKIIPVLTAVARRKQGNQKLNWGSWLKISENRYLYEVNEDIAKKIFEDTNALIPNKRTRGGGAPSKFNNNYSLTFTGDTNSSTRKGDLVSTDFNPDDYNLNLGFTISYWVRPDEVGQDMFAIGRKAHNNERFTFGISRSWKGYFGVGANQSERSWELMFDTAGIDKSTHLTQDGDYWVLKTDGTWYHFAVTYADRSDTSSGTLRKIYMNGQQIWGTGVSDPTYAGNINWSQTGTEMDGGLSFGMRAVRGSGTNTNYNNGWACGLDEVAIFDEEKDSDWVSATYNGGVPNNLKGQSGLVGYWRFEEGSGTTVEDLSGNGNHGTLTNDTLGADGGAAWVDATDTPTWSTDIP